MNETGVGWEKRNACKILDVNLKEGDSLDDLAVDGIRLLCILRKKNGRVWRGFCFFYHDDESSRYVKCVADISF